MTTTPVSIVPGAVVVDANVAVAISAKEADKETKAIDALDDYTSRDYELFAPGAISMEALYALCQKFKAGILTSVEYEDAVSNFEFLMDNIQPPPNGDVTIIRRAYEIGNGYGCSRSADGVYIALAEELARTRSSVLLTFDKELPKQAAKNAPTVNIHLLTV